MIFIQKDVLGLTFLGPHSAGFGSIWGSKAVRKKYIEAVTTTKNANSPGMGNQNRLRLICVV